ncbi:hypothetical protein COP2_036421 [Malus domestica]
MDFATIQAQLAELTAQLSQYAERTTMQNVLTCGHSQSWDNMFSTAYNSDWRDYSDYIEPQQFQQDGYW